LKIIRHTAGAKLAVKKIAWCGGSGSFLLEKAKAVKADVFITGDFKYHEFFDHENSLVIADIGHYESEQFTIDLLGHFLKEKFPKFAVHLTEINTNPVNYY
jgi:putative NIF3 family GTP cyclohydrolase 1 type 2